MGQSEARCDKGISHPVAPPLGRLGIGVGPPGPASISEGQNMAVRRKTVARITAVAVLSLSLAACGQSSHNVSRGQGDVPVGPQDRTPAKMVVNFPDAWGNVAIKCWGVNGLYEVTHNDNSRPPVTVIPNDPMCREGAK